MNVGKQRRLGWPIGVMLALLLAGCATNRSAGNESAQQPTEPSGESRESADLPPEFQQVLPRGRIAAIDKPEFVTAEEAEISEEAWVLGVVVDGQARAYSLNLLNRHEVVNDRINDKSFAAVW